MSSTGINDQAAQVKQLILGTQKHYPTGSVIQFGGASYTVTALTQLMQDFVDNRAAVETAKAALKTKVEAERAQAPSQTAVISAFVRIVRGTFGTSADALADFGLALPKARAPISAETKAVAAVKRAATRAARGTIGKNKKKAIKGDVSATLVVKPSGGSQPIATPTVPTGSASTGTTAPRAS
jgi:hypothetical protein